MLGSKDKTDSIVIKLVINNRNGANGKSGIRGITPVKYWGKETGQWGDRLLLG